MTHPLFGRHMSAEERYRIYVDRRSADECWNWLGAKTSDGYGSMGRARSEAGSSSQTCLAHRWGYEQLNGPIPAGQVVRHTCDNRACQNPRHWLLGTQVDNIRDMDERGRRNSKRLASIKLSDDQVREIRRLGGTRRERGYARGAVSQSELGRRFGVTQATISGIVLGKSRRDVAP